MTSPRYQSNSFDDMDYAEFGHKVEPPVEQAAASSSRIKIFAGLGAVVVGSMLATSMFSSQSGSFTFTGSTIFGQIGPAPHGMKGTDSIILTASDEYGDTSSNKFPYPFLVNALLASPYKTTTFSVTNPNNECTYAWAIRDINDAVVDKGKTTLTNFTTSNLETVGQYTLSIAESDCASTNDDTGSDSRTADYTVWVKYVRRELTSLTDEDRESFLNAFSTLWKVNTVDGQALYGENYKSLYYFASIHNDAGANSVCDEFHGDQGFVNNHMMLGAYLEQSLQLVDPSTCLHYMEYAEYFDSDAFDDHLSNQLDGGAWTELLTSKWFGANDPVSGRIIDGRWENASVPRLDDDFYADHGIDKDQVWFPTEATSWYESTDQSHLMNPYGLLRSPWNWNPSPYVTRYNNINLISDISSIDDSVRDFYSGVVCDDFDAFLEYEVRDKPFCNFLHYAEDNVHGKIHFTLGGAGGDYAYATNQQLKKQYNVTDSMLVLVAQGSQTFVKLAYPFYEKRSHYGQPYPFNCTEFPYDPDTETLWTDAAPGDADAICSLNTEYYCASQTHMDTLYKKYLAPFQDKSKGSQYELESLLLDLSMDQQCDVANTLIGRAGFDGEMAGSGAALDPLFWVAHGAVERLMQKVIFSGMTTDTDYDVEDSNCSGHMNSGTKYWLKGFYFQNTTIAAEDVTNVEFNTFLNPTTDEYRDYFNFVYDIDNYDFCSGSDDWFSDDA